MNLNLTLKKSTVLTLVKDSFAKPYSAMFFVLGTSIICATLLDKNFIQPLLSGYFTVGLSMVGVYASRVIFIFFTKKKVTFNHWDFIIDTLTGEFLKKKKTGNCFRDPHFKEKQDQKDASLVHFWFWIPLIIGMTLYYLTNIVPR